MRDFAVSLPKDKRPLYLRISSAIRDAIKTSRAQPGEWLPSCRTLAAQFDVNRHTVLAALDQLVAEGWIQAQSRKGYQVAAELPTQFFTAKVIGGTKKTPPSPANSTAPKPAKLRWDFRSGCCDLRLFPFDELKSSLSETMRRSTPSLFDYGDPAGHKPFIRELQKYLRRVRALVGRELVVTHGSQEGIFITAQVLLKKGDGVAVESLSYPAAREALTSTGATLHSVPLDAEGIDPDALARLCQKRQIKLLYLTPLHQYPTTVTLSLPRRMAIYEIAVKYGIHILEDDYDHEYHYRCQPLAPMAANDPAELVIYVSTFSKILFPSARLGFAVVPSKLTAEFMRVRTMTTTQNDTMIQDAVARWMRTDGFQRHLNRTRRTYEKRLQGLIAVLEKHSAAGLDLSWQVPDGGMAVWVKTPWDTEKLAATAALEGIMLQAEGPTRSDGESGYHLRLGFARHTTEELEKGLERLFQIGQNLNRRGNPG